MEEYHRDSLRELRRMESEHQTARRQKGSAFITFLIILLFLGAGGFYLKTTDRLPSFSTVKQTVIRWREDLAEVFAEQPAADVQETVDQALAEQNEGA